MNGLIKIKNETFGILVCDVYTNNKGEFFMTRKQIGEALEYDDPQKAIDKLHKRHKERLDQFSVTVRLGGTDKKIYETILYSAKGVYEICRWSRQIKADQFYDFVYKLLEGLRLGYLKVILEKQNKEWLETRTQGKLTRKSETDIIKNLVEYAKEQGSTHSDKLYVVYSKLANNAIDIKDRDNTTIMQLNNLSLVENIILNCIRENMKENKYYKDIYKSCKDRLEQFTNLTYLKMVG